jgi:hypothetical protein
MESEADNGNDHKAQMNEPFENSHWKKLEHIKKRFTNRRRKSIK